MYFGDKPSLPGVDVRALHVPKAHGLFHDDASSNGYFVQTRPHAQELLYPADICDVCEGDVGGPRGGDGRHYNVGDCDSHVYTPRGIKVRVRVHSVPRGGRGRGVEHADAYANRTRCISVFHASGDAHADFELRLDPFEYEDTNFDTDACCRKRDAHAICVKLADTHSI